MENAKEKVSTSSRLMQIMSERNLRQKDILDLAKPYCEKFGIKLPKNTLSQFVSGERIPRQDKLFILAHALDVSEGWLMGLDVPMERQHPVLFSHETEEIQIDMAPIMTTLYKRMGLSDAEAQRKAEAAKELASLSDSDMDFVLTAIRMAQGKKG